MGHVNYCLGGEGRRGCDLRRGLSGSAKRTEAKRTCIGQHVEERGFSDIRQACDGNEIRKGDCKGRHVPTIPILRLLDGRPRRIFFSGAAAFFGAIFFLRDGGDE